MGTIKTYPVYTINFWRCYIIQMRPYLLFISGIAGAMGMAMSPGFNTAGWKSVIAFIPFFTGYGFGQALTDCFQTDTDKLSAPYRPLSKGIISIRSVLIVSITGLLASGITFYLLNPVCFYLSLAAVAGLATYSYIKKHFWFAGPFYNAWIVTLLPLMGYFSLTDLSLKDFPKEFFTFILVSFFSYTSFVLIGYLKDIEADKATGYKTFPVVFGWKKTALAGDFIALATLIFFWLSVNYNWLTDITGIMGTIIIISGQVIAHLSKQENEKEALVPILATVRSFVLLHIAVILQFHSYLWPYALLYYGLFEWALYKRPSKYQV
jgi:4-hydroxybenzoate polyprenyltransferase